MLWLVALPAVAMAATISPLSLSDLTSQATVICTCRMVDQQSDWDVGKNMLVTNVTLQVEEYVKGGDDAEVVVELFIGFGQESQNILGGAIFEQGERMILFLKPADAGDDAGNRYHIVGWAQGKFTIRTNAKTGQERIERNLRGIEFSTPEAMSEFQALETPRALKSAVQSATASGSESPPAP